MKIMRFTSILSHPYNVHLDSHTLLDYSALTHKDLIHLQDMYPSISLLQQMTPFSPSISSISNSFGLNNILFSIFLLILSKSIVLPMNQLYFFVITYNNYSYLSPIYSAKIYFLSNYQSAYTN